VSTAIGEHAARIRALDDHWLEAAAQRDLDGMLAIYAAAARELPPDTPALVGRDAIRAFSARLLDQRPRFAHRVAAEEISVGEAGDLEECRIGCIRGKACGVRWLGNCLKTRNPLNSAWVCWERHRLG